MKNTIRFLGIIVLITVIGFAMVACGDGSGDGGGGSSGATLGQETLSITDQQVQTGVFNPSNGTISYSNYTGSDLTLSDRFSPPLGVAVISGGKFTYTQTGAPTGSQLESIRRITAFLAAPFQYFDGRDFSDDDDFELSENLEERGCTWSDESAKGAIIYYFHAGYKDSLFRGNESLSNYNAAANTGTSTREEVYYVYVDKNVTITASKFGPVTWDPTEDEDYEEGDDPRPGEYTINAINLSLTKGWNAVTNKWVRTVTTAKSTSTISATKGDTGKWILQQWDDD